MKPKGGGGFIEVELTQTTFPAQIGRYNTPFFKRDAFDSAHTLTFSLSDCNLPQPPPTEVLPPYDAGHLALWLSSKSNPHTLH